MKRKQAHQRYAVRECPGDFLSDPDKSLMIFPTGVIGSDAREIAISVKWEVILRAFANLAERNAGRNEYHGG